MCSEHTPRAHIPDTRIPQLMQPCMPWCPTCLIEYEWSLFKRRKLANLESQYFKQTLIKSHQLCDLENLPHSLLDHFFALLLVKLWTLTFKSECTRHSLLPSMSIKYCCVLVCFLQNIWRRKYNGKVSVARTIPGQKFSLTSFQSVPFFLKILESHETMTRYALKKKIRYYLGIFPNIGGVFPNPKTFVNLPSIFLYAKFILRC